MTKRILAALLGASMGWHAQGMQAQGLEPERLLHPSTSEWPTYNGDYSGKRFSTLRQIDSGNVGMLALAWAFQTGVPNGAGLKATPLLVDGVAYFTEPDDVWAVDAKTGRQRWHYHNPPNEGLHIGQRGVGMYKEWIYFETPDAHLLCLSAKDGSLVWNVELADVKLGYWATMAPLVVGDHVLVGTSGDFNDLRGFLAAFDPETGKLQWRWSALPEAGGPGSETWPSHSDALRHGGGNPWITGTYDPELNLVFWGTGNPNPVLDGSTRPGDNLYTCTIVALNPDTGRLVWHFQPSPHDVHDWDAVQTPIVVDAEFHGSMRKLLLQASRNGYYFVLDRTNGKALLSVPYAEINWSKSVNGKGQPVGELEKYPSHAGTLVEPDALGATNWMAPSFSPDTGLLYVDAHRSFSMYYDYASDKPEGFAGRDLSIWSESSLKALDYKTGKARWEHPLGRWEDWASVLSTAGNLVFTGDTQGNMLALDAGTGETLWHAYGGGAVQAAPITYELDGRQYVLIGSSGVLYAFSLPEALLDQSHAAAK